MLTKPSTPLNWKVARMSRCLNMFILDDMIEQYNRHNPLPEVADNPTVEDSMNAELLAGLLKELQVLRNRCALYEVKIVHLERELRTRSQP